MFQKLKRSVIASLCFFVSVTALAQEEAAYNKIPRYVSSKGYWVIQSNVKQPKEAVVYFYNLQHVLVYKEEVKNVKLNINRTGVKMRLKKALDKAIVAYDKGGRSFEDEKIIATAFRKN